MVTSSVSPRRIVAYLFPSEKTGKALSERSLGYLVKRYASAAGLTDVSPHDLSSHPMLCLISRVRFFFIHL
jgi:site-specific recombinase XerD